MMYKKADMYYGKPQIPYGLTKEQIEDFLRKYYGK